MIVRLKQNAYRGMKHRLSRRQILASGAGAFASTALGGGSLSRQYAAAQDRSQVIIGVGGGAWEAAQDVAYFGPFQEETGIEVVKVPFPDLAKYRAMVETGNVELDISDVDAG